MLLGMVNYKFEKYTYKRAHQMDSTNPVIIQQLQRKPKTRGRSFLRLKLVSITN